MCIGTGFRRSAGAKLNERVVRLMTNLGVVDELVQVQNSKAGEFHGVNIVCAEEYLPSCVLTCHALTS